MSKKLNKQNIKNKQNNESEEEFEIEEVDDVEVEVEEFDEETNDEKDEKDDNMLDQETDQMGCAIDDAIEDDDEYFENIEETELSVENSLEYVSKENRISINRLTKYEMVRILGERTKQLTTGAKPLIKNHHTLSYEEIAEEELKKNMIPFKIIRPLPNNKFEMWTISELDKEHLLPQL
jgi:DNA-directed RNA polymerase subunit K/omega